MGGDGSGDVAGDESVDGAVRARFRGVEGAASVPAPPDFDCDDDSDGGAKVDETLNAAGPEADAGNGIAGTGGSEALDLPATADAVAEDEEEEERKNELVRFPKIFRATDEMLRPLPVAFCFPLAAAGSDGGLMGAEPREDELGC